MVRAILTFWYTATVLLGPGVCCCSLRTTVVACPSVQHEAKPQKAKRSCCSTESDSGTSPEKAPAKDRSPHECPCKHQKSDQLPTNFTVQNGFEVFSQLRALDFVHFDCVLVSPYGRPSVQFVDSLTDWWSSASKLSGRDLLSAYQILRC